MIIYIYSEIILKKGLDSVWKVENGWAIHSKKQTRVYNTESELIVETSDEKDIEKIKSIFKDHILSIEKSGEESFIFIISKNDLLKISYKK